MMIYNLSFRKENIKKIKKRKHVTFVVYKENTQEVQLVKELNDEEERNRRISNFMIITLQTKVFKIFILVYKLVLLYLIKVLSN